jgi:hypothetical protein
VLGIKGFGKGIVMKMAIAAFSTILFASSSLHSAHAQAQIGVPGIGQVTIGQPPPPTPRGYGRPQPQYDRHAEHCEHLGYREHELRERVAYMPYGRERARLEEELRDLHAAREECWHR